MKITFVEIGDCFLSFGSWLVGHTLHDIEILKNLFTHKSTYYILAVVLCICGLTYVINRQQPDTRKVKTEASLTAIELLYQLDGEDKEDLGKYIEKAIEIKGELFQVTQKNGVYSLLLQGQHSKALVLCEMQMDQTDFVENLTVGQQVTVKGILKGFLLDVILLNCIIIPEEVNE